MIYNADVTRRAPKHCITALSLSQKKNIHTKAIKAKKYRKSLSSTSMNCIIWNFACST